MPSLIIQAKTLSPEKTNIMFNLGPFQTTWAAFYIIGLLLGSYASQGVKEV